MGQRARYLRSNRNRNRMTQNAGSHPEGPSNRPRTAPTLAKGWRRDQTRLWIEDRSFRKPSEASKEASIPWRAAGKSMDLTTRTRPWKSSGRAKIRTRREMTRRTLAAKVEDHQRKGQHPILHTLSNHPESDAQKDTLTGSRLLTNQPDIANCEPSGPQENTKIPSNTLEIVSIQLRLNPHLSSKIPTPRQTQRHNEHHTQKTPLGNTHIPCPRIPAASLKRNLTREWYSKWACLNQPGSPRLIDTLSRMPRSTVSKDLMTSATKRWMSQSTTPERTSSCQEQSCTKPQQSYDHHQH